MTAASSPNPQSPDPGAISFEAALEQVESIIERIEAGEVGLEQSLAEYERGVTLINRCRAILASAEQRVVELTERMEQSETGGGKPKGRASARRATNESDATGENG